jgi:hypothetical protein
LGYVAFGPYWRWHLNIQRVERHINRVVAAAGLEKGKNVLSLSPPSGAMHRIGAVADEERSKPQFD